MRASFFSSFKFWEEQRLKAKAVPAVFELIQLLALAAVIVIPLRYFFVQPFYVKGNSMEPNFYEREYLFIDKISYRTGEPQRGDVVVIRYPLDPEQYFIKRIIGLPGETVEIANGHVKIYNQELPNGFILPEPYLKKDTASSKPLSILKVGEYFVMGDNRPSSLDSRVFGPIKRSALVGRVWIRGYPFDRWHLFTYESYPTPSS